MAFGRLDGRRRAARALRGRGAGVRRALELVDARRGELACGGADLEDRVARVLLRVSVRAGGLADEELILARVVLERDGDLRLGGVEPGLGDRLAVAEVLGVEGVQRA